MRNALVDEGNKFCTRAMLPHPCRSLGLTILLVLLQFYDLLCGVRGSNEQGVGLAEYKQY